MRIVLNFIFVFVSLILTFVYPFSMEQNETKAVNQSTSNFFPHENVVSIKKWCEGDDGTISLKESLLTKFALEADYVYILYLMDPALGYPLNIPLLMIDRMRALSSSNLLKLWHCLFLKQELLKKEQNNLFARVDEYSQGELSYEKKELICSQNEFLQKEEDRLIKITQILTGFLEDIRGVKYDGMLNVTTCKKLGIPLEVCLSCPYFRKLALYILGDPSLAPDLQTVLHAFKKVGKYSKIRDIALEMVKTDEDLAAFVEAAQYHPSFERFVLNLGNFTQEGIQKFRQFLETHTHLQCLRVVNHDCASAEVLRDLALLSCSSVIHLKEMEIDDFSDCMDEFGLVLDVFGKSTSLERLSIGRGFNPASGSGKYFVSLISENKFIKDLCLKFNGFNNEDIRIIAQALQKNETLTSLDVRYNHLITLKGLRLLFEHVAVHPSLKVIYYLPEDRIYNKFPLKNTEKNRLLIECIQKGILHIEK